MAVVFDGSFAAGSDDNYELKQTFTPTETSSITSVSAWVNSAAMAYDLFYSDGTDHEFFFSGNNTWQLLDMTSNLEGGKFLTAISFWGNIGSAAYVDDAAVNVGSSAPEPASWAMMLGGFVLVGGAMRARRKAALTFDIYCLPREVNGRR